MADLIALAISVNPSLQVQAMQTNIAGLNLRKARMVRKPDFTIGPSLEYSKSEQILGLSAAVALPSKNYGQGEILTATAEQRKILAETDALRREITGAVAKAATQLAGARAQLALYSPAYLDQLKAVVAEAEKSYAQNATSLLIYLDARRTYFDTLADYHESIADVAAARAELESAVGAPLQ
jgi:outer membrane protein TolC